MKKDNGEPNGKSRRESTRGSYRHKQAWYAAKIADAGGPGTVRTVRRMVQLGQDSGELPPFDDLAHFPAWWEKHHPKRKTPAWVECIAQVGEAEQVASRKDGQRQAAADASAMESGYAAMLARAEEDERVATVKRREALAGGCDEMEETRLTRRVNDAREQVRKLKKDAEQILATDDKYDERAKWTAIVEAKNATLNQTLRTLPARVCSKLSLPVDQLRAVDAAFQEELDYAFGLLERSNFDEPFQLEAA